MSGPEIQQGCKLVQNLLKHGIRLQELDLIVFFMGTKYNLKFQHLREVEISNLEKLNIGVEEITLGDVNVFKAELVDKGEDASSDGGFSDGRNGGKRTEGRFVF